VRRHFFFEKSVIDCTKERKEPMRGIYKLRLKMTELNALPLEFQREQYKSSSGGDAAINKVLIKSLCESYLEICRVIIDVRLYGMCPEMEIYVPDFEFTFYLSELQIEKVKLIWSKIDPESTNGIRYQQMLDSSKALATLYNKIPVYAATWSIFPLIPNQKHTQL
ncbi:MAG: hypothetical protein Harvfovirus33_13, partial [Harvfovirus sp.]